ncbi:hypothetical protein So717_41380 [Roseobacter cerasinus]|uniref:Uncharacterized protein n=1 Tax=Roseobacter cerasinus TaxID=2602289 RepID=A0A640VZP0_9RHOB|nr:hypothetical protein So717_41380 [Roseobacter cerasinus]
MWRAAANDGARTDLHDNLLFLPNAWRADRLTGTHSVTIKRNEREALICLHRDQEQRDRLILAQMTERKDLQTRARTIRDRHKIERQHLAKTIATYLKRPKPNISGPDQALRRRNRSPGLNFDR